MKLSIHHYKKGFSLVEMIVSLGIFALVSVVALGAFIKIIDANKKAQALKTAINNLNFTLESMSREMRVGTDYYCGNSDPSWTAFTKTACSGGSVMAFRSSVAAPDGSGGTCNLIYVYKLVTSANPLVGKIQKAEQTSCGSTPTYDDVTAKDIVITTTNPFSVIIPTVKGVPGQPYAKINLQGYSGSKEKIKTTFSLQTSVSPRLMNN